MVSRFNNNNNNNNPFFIEQDEHEITPENSADSPPLVFHEIKINSTSSPKRSRRGIPKRIVSVPIKEIEGSRIKSDSAPPSDSWAWRKYGQKPIKGSPYPRGYYRCSSSKGCPARKQVERSSADPTMMVVTYSSDHNHPWPPSKNHNHHHSAAAITAGTPKVSKPEVLTPDPKPDPEPEQEHEEKFPDLGPDEFTWFTEMETTSSNILEIPIFTERRSIGNDDVGMFFPMREEDESLFADLGELPECSTLLRHLGVGPQFEIC